MFGQIREGRLVGYVSDLVFAELAETPHPSLRDALLERARELLFLRNRTKPKWMPLLTAT